MKPTAILINTARGPIIEDRALHRALSEAWIAGAGLFVTPGRERLDQAALERQPDAGRLFAVIGLGVGGPGCASYSGRVPSGWMPR